MRIKERVMKLLSPLLLAACGDNKPSTHPDAPARRRSAGHAATPFVHAPTPFAVPLSAAGPDQLQSVAAGPDGTFYAAGFAAQTVAGAKSSSSSSSRPGRLTRRRIRLTSGVVHVDARVHGAAPTRSTSRPRATARSSFRPPSRTRRRSRSRRRAVPPDGDRRARLDVRRPGTGIASINLSTAITPAPLVALDGARGFARRSATTLSCTRSRAAKAPRPAAARAPIPTSRSRS